MYSPFQEGFERCVACDGLGSAGLMVGLDDLRGLFQYKGFYDSLLRKDFLWLHIIQIISWIFVMSQGSAILWFGRAKVSELCPKCKDKSKINRRK